MSNERLSKLQKWILVVDSGANLPPILEKVATHSGANLPPILVESLPLFG